MEKLLIIDGNSILNRAFYGIRPLNAPDGTPTNAVYGFLNILFKYLEEQKPDYVCVAFDLKAPTFRHKMYSEYKAQRKPAPEDLILQMPIIKEVLTAMNFSFLEKEGYEADDIIGTVSRICEEKSIECNILTGDKDDLQLASPTTHINLVITRMGNSTTTEYDDKAVVEKYGVTPGEFIDVKGLMGDPSDNIPGVRGIGEKTAFSLIQKYKSIKNIYENIDSIEVTPSVRKKLTEGKDSAELSYTLATIDRNVDMEINISDFRMKEYDSSELKAELLKLGFKSFLKKLDLDEAEEQPVRAEIEITDVPHDEFNSVLKHENVCTYYLSFENNSLYFCDSADSVYVLSSFTDDDLKLFFQNEDIKKNGFSVKQDMVKLSERNIEFKGLEFDVAIASYLIEPSRAQYDIEMLCKDYLGYDIFGGGNEDAQISMDFSQGANKRSEYAEYVSALIKLRERFKAELEEKGQTQLFENIELPLISVLADMQSVGVYVDKNALKEFGAKLNERINVLEKRIYEQAEGEFNINSPKQLGAVLFERLHLPHGKKTKRGYSTNIDVLNKLKAVNPIAADIIEYRQLAKLNSTYVTGLLSVINQCTGRIHSNFNQTVTTTGRISSTEPNLQNIPVRTELGREIRRMFAAQKEDTLLVDADYSQIELRVLAHISEDENMCDAFLNGTDIHTRTASQVFGVPLESVTSIMRTRAKAVNFGIVYGIGAFSLSQDLGISVKEADTYIKTYLENFTGVDKYMKQTIEQGKKDGYVTTMFGRRRYLPELNAKNKVTQAFGERAAMNAPIQGSAADIIKIAMVNVYTALKERGLKSKLILQVHDELIIEAIQTEVEEVKEILKSEMENVAKLRVPLVVDMNVGKTWYDTK